MNKLEHANITVANPQQTANLFCEIFDWEIRWAGDAQNGGHSIHVGEPANGGSYVALYAPQQAQINQQHNHRTINNLNHIAVVTDDIESVHENVLQQQLETFNHADYEPGRRFYFYLQDNLEVEVVSYQQ